MRITDTNNAGNSAAIRADRTAQTQAAEHANRNESAKAAASGSDRVELSGFSGKVAEALNVDTQNRAERVSSIAAAVRSGSYKVDAKAVSHAMVNDAISGGGPQ